MDVPVRRSRVDAPVLVAPRPQDVITKQPWTDVERHCREAAYAQIDADPQVLLEHDTTPDGIDADLFHARLIGFDDQIVRELWLTKPLAVVLEAIPRPMTFAPVTDSTDPFSPAWDDDMLYGRTARYHLQSGQVIWTVSLEVTTWPPIEKCRPDRTVKIAYLRYRRRA